MKKKQKTILITGGHLTPAIATLEELQKRDSTLRIVFIGRTHATEHHKDLSHEKEEMDKLGIQFISVTTGRIQRFISIHSLISLLKIPIGFFQALRICFHEKPSCIVSFGGYVALPVVVAGWVLGVPTVTHEQTSVMGLANRIIARFAKKICVTFPEMLSSLSKEKGVYTGLPIRRSILNIGRHPTAAQKRPVVYVTGGTTGAVSVNVLVYPKLSDMLSLCDIIHQTGRLSYDEAMRYKMSLSKELQNRYHVYSYVSDDQLTDIFNSVSFVIGRSGANTTIELATLGIPMICIPLPWSGGGEQLQNATWLSSKGAAVILKQNTTTPDSLFHTMKHMFNTLSKIQSHAQTLAATMPHNGATLVVNEVMSLL